MNGSETIWTPGALGLEQERRGPCGDRTIRTHGRHAGQLRDARCRGQAECGKNGREADRRVSCKAERDTVVHGGRVAVWGEWSKERRLLGL